jgi:cytidyltransferase-like protein
MAGINHLYDIYNKKGSDFVDQLFNQFVTINEKMDGSAFSFERDRETGKFKFYRRDQRNPITLIDRTLMKYYEKPIQYIESLPPSILEKIPRGWRFGLEYFASRKPVEISYDRLPKNNLILSYVHKISDTGKIETTIQDKSKLDSWADILGVERPPIIFQGILDEDQKSDLLEFLNTPFKELVEKFKTQSFVRFVISTLNPDLEKTALNDNLDKDVEGIVFRFGDPEKEGETVLAKMVDPIFTEIAKEKFADKQSQKPSDFLGITLLDVMNFILEKGLDEFNVEGETDDERYISFMSDVFVKFLDEYADKYKGTDFEEPEYLQKDDFRLNRDKVKDKRVLKYVEKDSSFESLYKLILNSFRKIKTRAGGIVTSGMKDQLNLLIQDIKDYIKKPKKVNESKFVSFGEFRKELTPNVDYIQEESDETENSDNPFYSFDEFITKLETIDSENIPDNIELIEEEKKKDRMPVNVIMGRFQPFHSGHLNMAKELKEKNGHPSVAIVVYPGHNKSGKSPFDEATIKRYMDAVVDNNKEIESYIIMNRGLLGSGVAKLIEMGYDPILIGAGEDRIEDYKKQVDYLKMSDIKDQISDDLKLKETPRVTSATDVRKVLADGDFSKFKKMVPKEVANMYNDLVTSVKN